MNLGPLCYKITGDQDILRKYPKGYIQQQLWWLEQIPSLCMHLCHDRAWTISGRVESVKGGKPDVKQDSLVYRGRIVLLGLSSAHRDDLNLLRPVLFSLGLASCQPLSRVNYRMINYSMRATSIKCSIVAMIFIPLLQSSLTILQMLFLICSLSVTLSPQFRSKIQSSTCSEQNNLTCVMHFQLGKSCSRLQCIHYTTAQPTESCAHSCLLCSHSKNECARQHYPTFDILSLHTLINK